LAALRFRGVQIGLNTGIVTGVVVANSGVSLLARILGNGGRPITQASLASVAIQVTDTVTGTGVLLSESVAATVFDSLVQNDPRWTKDTAAYPGPDGAWGYNFLATIPAANSFGGTSLDGTGATVMNRMQADCIVTPVSGQPFRVVFQWEPIRVYG
jgi:hypothetical protein